MFFLFSTSVFIMCRIFKNTDVKIQGLQFYSLFFLIKIDSVNNIYVVLETFFNIQSFLATSLLVDPKDSTILVLL